MAAGFTVLSKANYLLVQAYNAGFTASQVLMNAGEIPAESEFVSTALWTDSAGAAYGYFSEAPGGRVVYCNGVDTCIWGGEEIDQTGFIVSTAADTATNPADYTDVLQNTRHDTENVATIGGAAGKYFFVRSPLPLQGVIFYIDPGSENGTASVLTVNEWAGSAWSPLAITDGTSVNGVSMAQGGSVEWATTVATSKQHIIEGGVGYWYQFYLPAGSVKLYYVTLDAPFQQIVDVWDGLDNSIAACFKKTTVYENYTINVLEDIYDSADPTTYLNISSMAAYAADANCVIMGFFERMTAFNIGVGTDKTNSTAATTAAVDYWDGAIFTTVGTITDGTSETVDDLVGLGAFTGAATGWTLAAGWTYSSDTVKKDGDGVGTLAKDTFAAVATHVYKITFTISAWTVGTVTVSLGGVSGPAVSGNGPFSVTVTATGTTGLAFTPTNTARFTIDDVIVTDSADGISLAKTGTISFSPPDPWLVFKRVLSDNAVPLYYYRLRFDKAMDASTAIYYISGIPAPKQIRGYKFPLYSQDRLMLCCNMDGKRNSILVTATGTSQFFNGDDSFEEEFGNHEEINSGCTVFSQYGSNLFNITLLFKDKEMWGFVRAADSWVKYLISPTIGCPAPLTLNTMIIPSEDPQQATTNRSFAIWMGTDGVFVSEGKHPLRVSHDIRNLFEQNSSVHINQNYIKSFQAYVDRNRMEYHLLVALTSGTVTELDAEYVLDMRRWKWFTIERGTGKRLQCAVNVTDAYGNNFDYGFIDTGYMERLENGTDFDGTTIASTLQTGDFPLVENDMMTETSIKAIVPVMVAKTVTAEDVTLTHYIDTAATGTNYAADPTNAGKRLVFRPVLDATAGKMPNTLPGLYHSIKLSIVTNDEVAGLEPLLLGIFYQQVREHNYI
uniref:Uncharacterized protein n=1 Tax=viral metagenome TaxID=1070528 RepID=A0A6M3KQV7_9ZZZZ